MRRYEAAAPFFSFASFSSLNSAPPREGGSSFSCFFCAYFLLLLLPPPPRRGESRAEQSRAFFSAFSPQLLISLCLSGSRVVATARRNSRYCLIYLELTLLNSPASQLACCSFLLELIC